MKQEGHNKDNEQNEYERPTAQGSWRHVTTRLKLQGSGSSAEHQTQREKPRKAKENHTIRKTQKTWFMRWDVKAVKSQELRDVPVSYTESILRISIQLWGD